MGIYQYENLFNHGYYTEREFDDIKAACWMGYKSDACIAVRKIADKKFYATNTSMLNLYAKCLYQKVQVFEDKKFVRLSHGRKVPTMEDGVICEDMYGIHHYFNEVSIQAGFHVHYSKF